MAGNNAVKGKKKQTAQPIGEPFAPVLDRLLYGNEAFLRLPPLAKVLLIYIIAEAPRPYNGEEIRMGARDAEKLLGVHFTTAAKAMREVDKSGLATITDKGRGVKHGYVLRASRWELTFWKGSK
jgi:hypothetical protein